MFEKPVFLDGHYLLFPEYTHKSRLIFCVDENLGYSMRIGENDEMTKLNLDRDFDSPGSLNEWE